MNDSITNDGLKWNSAITVEKRKAQRRSGKDQREMLRFELDKEDRRSENDRRSSVTSWGSDAPV